MANNFLMLAVWILVRFGVVKWCMASLLLAALVTETKNRNRFKVQIMHAEMGVGRVEVKG
jgi:hypothetical protein